MINTIENLFKVEATDYTDRATKHFPDWAKETMRTSLKRKKKNGDKKVKTDCKFLNSNKHRCYELTRNGLFRPMIAKIAYFGYFDSVLR